MAVATYPVRVEAALDPQISRWLWLAKWLLAIPHYFVLALLWCGFVVVSALAFFAILFTGRYPRGLFEFNVGVLRWSWRVSYYTYGALGTDRYPPFTLDEVADYPAHFEVSYPEHLSRGLVLVKWWLLAIPHYLVVGLFVGGGTWAAWRFGDWNAGLGPGGLIGVLVLVAAVVLAFTGRYPQQIFDFVLGLNRWVLRVAAYASLMTDEYPPFRLDLGGSEPGHTLTLPAGPGGAGPGGPPGPAPEPGARPRTGWTAPRIVSLVAGSVLVLTSFGLLAAGGGAAWLDNTQRDAAGYLTSGQHLFATPSSGITSDRIEWRGGAVGPSDLVGTVRVRATATPGRGPVFIGIAQQPAVERYLAGVSHDVVTDWVSGTTRYVAGTGAGPAVAPAAAGIWIAQASGEGTQTLTWNPVGGNWAVVVMNADGHPGMSVLADVGATVPPLGWIALGLLLGGAVVLVVGAVLVAVPVVRAGR